MNHIKRMALCFLVLIALPLVVAAENLSREFTVSENYLVIPIENGARRCLLTLTVDGREVLRYGTEVATSPEKVDWYAFFTIERYKGKPAVVAVTQATKAGFELVCQADRVPGSDRWYTEALRPQFHFSQKVGWNNDPNGMVYLDGEWHLFFQHNPVGIRHGNMTWGHAVSKDLVHWEQLPNALFPGTMAKGSCYSGSATVDVKNTAGWKTGENDVLVAFVTDTSTGESVAYSNDRGRTFTWYEGNPVVKHQGRDPKVIWYAYDKDDTPLNPESRKLGGHWVMVVFDVTPGVPANFAFYTSTDLKEWTEQSHLPGYHECPEIFALPVDGDERNTRWVVFDAHSTYALGDFDGKVFTPAHEGKHRVHHGSYYAAQTFSNPPDGRRIQMGWARIELPNMPFNQAFSVPTRLTLHTTEDGIRMFAYPIKELEKLRKANAKTVKNRKLTAGAPALEFDADDQHYDIVVTLKRGSASRAVLRYGAESTTYDFTRQQLDGLPLRLKDNTVAFRVLVDRPIREIVGGDGACYKTAGRRDAGKPLGKISLTAEGGDLTVESLEVYEMKSVWKKTR